MQIQSGNCASASPTMPNYAGLTRAMWIGRALGTLAVALLIMDGVGKLLQVQPVLEATAQLGYRSDVVFGLGVTLLLCVLLYVVPQTSVLGAVLLTGYLGGAVATHVRVGSPFFTTVLFPIYVAAFLWGSLMLRDARLWTFMPWGHRSES